MQSLLTILKSFFDICLLRKRPQDIPASSTFLFFCLIAYTLCSAAVALASYPGATALFIALVETGLFLLFVYFLLSLRSLTERWLQTSTALAGSGTLLGIISSPLHYWLAAQEPGVAVSPEPVFLFLLLLVWNILVVGHILRHAMSIPFFAGVLVSICYLVLLISTMSALFPNPAAA